MIDATLIGVAKCATSAQNTDQVIVGINGGTLLVFPAFLEHSVGPNQSRDVRISVSFPAQHADIIAALLSARGVDPDVDKFLHRGLAVEHRNGWGALASLLASQNAILKSMHEADARKIK